MACKNSLLENLPLCWDHLCFNNDICLTKKLSSLVVWQRKLKLYFILQTGYGCLLEWETFLFLKNGVISLFLLCYGLRQPFLTMIETTIFSFSPSDFKMVSGGDFRGKLLNCMIYMHMVKCKCPAFNPQVWCRCFKSYLYPMNVHWINSNQSVMSWIEGLWWHPFGLFAKS